MEVILLENIGKLGQLGQKVAVKNGYGRNYLIPKGKAVSATKANVEKFEARRAELEAAAAERLNLAQQRAESLNEFVVNIASKAGDEGKLFGSIGARDIADAVSKAGITLEKSEVRLPDGVLRHVGQHTITVQLHAEVSVDITVDISAAE